MKASVMIHMKTQMTDIEGKEQYELQIEGSLQSKGDFTYLQYEESIKDSGTVHNLFKIGKDELIVIRKGTISMRQQIIIGKKTSGIYQTPYGRLPFDMETKDFYFSWDDTKRVGRLHIEYTMTIEGSEKRNYNVTVNMKEVGTNE